MTKAFRDVCTDAVLLIQRRKRHKVTLTIQRPGQDKSMEVTITSDEIPIETVYAEMKDDGVAKIQITSSQRIRIRN